MTQPTNRNRDLVAQLGEILLDYLRSENVDLGVIIGPKSDSNPAMLITALSERLADLVQVMSRMEVYQDKDQNDQYYAPPELGRAIQGAVSQTIGVLMLISMAYGTLTGVPPIPRNTTTQLLIDAECTLSMVDMFLFTLRERPYPEQTTEGDRKIREIMTTSLHNTWPAIQQFLDAKAVNK